MGRLARALNRLIDGMRDAREIVIGRMAREAGITPSTVGQILRGEITRPPDNRLRGFARVLGVSFEYLLQQIPESER